MKTLVLCVDRDNGFGRKTAVESPVIGEEKNLDAAKALALVDPEDSDVNCLFSALSVYGKIKDEAEIATICGDINVGEASDVILAKELDEVLEKVKPDGAIVVTDGAEDEYILPLIQSRIKINAVKRVVVKQSETLEGTYYLLSRFMEDEKMQKKFVLPIALVLFVWGISALFLSPALGFSTVLIVLGAYLLTRVFHLEGAVTTVGKEVYAGLRSGKISLFSSLLALFIAIGAILSAYNVLSSEEELEMGEYVIRFIKEVLWWLLLAVFISAFGRFTDAYFREKKVLWSYTLLPFSLVAFGLILWASLDLLLKVINNAQPLSYLLTIPFLTKILGGVLIAFIGMVLHHILEDVYGEEKAQKD